MERRRKEISGKETGGKEKKGHCIKKGKNEEHGEGNKANEWKEKGRKGGRPETQHEGRDRKPR